MTDLERLDYLKLALRVVGVIAIFGIYPLTVLLAIRLVLVQRKVGIP